MPYITDREVGRVEQVLADVQHRARNDRQLILFLQEEVDSLRLDLERTKTRIYTALSVVTVIATILAWVFETFGTGGLG